MNKHEGVIHVILTKLTNKSLVTDQDVSFNYRLGIPVEVFDSEQGKTLAFGQIEAYSEQLIHIHGSPFCRSSYLFFGQPAQPAPASC